MATVERRNTETDEKHSLSSFDKRRAQCIAFGARQHNKKYRIADKISNSGNVPAAVKNIFDEMQENSSVEKVSVKPNVIYASSQKKNIVSHCTNSETHYESQTSIEDKSTISPEMAERMKRAAFLAQQNKEAIAINTVALVSDEAAEIGNEIVDEKRDPIPENSKEYKENTFESKFTGNSDSVDFSRHDAVRHDYAVNQAYGRYTDNNRRKQQEQYNRECRNVLDEVSSAAAITGQLAKGEVGKVVADTVIKSALSDNGMLNSVQTIGNSVSSASSVGSAVPDVAATLAAVEAKKMVAKILKGESSEKDRAFIEEHKANDRTKYVDSDTQRHKADWQLSEDKALLEEMSREKRRNYLHNQRVSEKQKSFYANRKETERKNKQKEMFLDFNKDNPDLASNTAKSAGKKYVVKKASKALIGGGAASAFAPIIIIIIVFAFCYHFYVLS